MIREPYQIIINYLVGNFIVDVLAIYPWQLVQKNLVFLRLIKCIRFNEYWENVEEIMTEIMIFWINNIQIKKILSAVRLFMYFVMMTHLFANTWVLIGLHEYLENNQGWIKENIENDM